MNDQATEITLAVIKVLDDLNVPYLIGGSLASSIHGVARSTLDSDIVAELKEEHIARFVRSLEKDFYVAEEAIKDAIRSRSSFNLIHFASSFKVDIFVPKNRPFDRQQFANRVKKIVANNPDRTAFIATAEDTILAKLEWYRQGDEISERQWLDILGILSIRAGELDYEYLHKVALELGVSDLLHKALESI